MLAHVRTLVAEDLRQLKHYLSMAEELRTVGAANGLAAISASAWEGLIHLSEVWGEVVESTAAPPAFLQEYALTAIEHIEIIGLYARRESQARVLVRLVDETCLDHIERCTVDTLQRIEVHRRNEALLDSSRGEGA